MVGFNHEFKRHWNASEDAQVERLVLLGHIDSIHAPTEIEPVAFALEEKPRGLLETLAVRVPPPRVSENFLAPVDGVGDCCCPIFFILGMIS